MKTGILGGTFDPVHNGHLAIAEEARTYLNLNEILFLPAGQPWMKSDRPISPAEIALRCYGWHYRPTLFQTLYDGSRALGPSYSVDTIAKLKAQSAGASDLYFIIGWDNLTQYRSGKNRQN